MCWQIDVVHLFVSKLDQLTPENFENPGTSKSSIHREKEKYRIESLKSAQLKHVTVDSWQLCYDGKIIDGIDRYVFIGQCFDQEKVSTPLQLASSVISKRNVRYFSCSVQFHN